MELSEIQFEEALPIEGYGPGFFRIGGQVINGAMLAHIKGAQPWAGYADLDAILAFKDDIDVVLLGTGSEIAHAPVALREALEGAGMGVEVMQSASACRTYNILLSEGRRVLAAVLPV